MTTEANSYETPNATQTLVDNRSAAPCGGLATRYRVAMWLLLYLFPIWLLSSFYLTWSVAWINLGHRPRPSLDDPKFIGGTSHIAYFLPKIVMLFMPVLAPIGLAASFSCPINARGGLRHVLGAGLAVLYIVLCTILLLTLRSDPGRVVEWWFD